MKCIPTTSPASAVYRSTVTWVYGHSEARYTKDQNGGTILEVVGDRTFCGGAVVRYTRFMGSSPAPAGGEKNWACCMFIGNSGETAV